MGFIDNIIYSILLILPFMIWECLILLLNEKKRFVGFCRNHVYISQNSGVVSALKLMILIPNCGQQRAKVLFYNINSAAPCCDLNCSQMLSFETPQGLCPSSCDPSAAGRLYSRPAIKLTGTSLLCMCLFDTTQQEWHYGLVAALALITHTATHYISPWGDADRGTRTSVWSTSSHSVEVAIRGSG